VLKNNEVLIKKQLELKSGPFHPFFSDQYSPQSEMAAARVIHRGRL